MKIKWYGHSAFRILTNDGTSIILDPYEPNCFNGDIAYSPITDPADIVTISHDHVDHNWYKGIKGNPLVVKDSGAHTPKGFHIKGVSSYHDKSHGRERGSNTIFIFDIDKMRVCHAGDLGHELSPSDATLVGPIDILLVPVGGFFTIDAKEAAHVVDRLQPKVVIPMHYKTDKCGFPIAAVTKFAMGAKVKNFGQPEIEITDSVLPKEREIWVIPHAN